MGNLPWPLDVQAASFFLSVVDGLPNVDTRRINICILKPKVKYLSSILGRSKVDAVED